MDAKLVCRHLIVGTVVCLMHASLGHAQSVAADTRPETATRATVSVDMVNAPLAEVLKSIARQAGLRASWDDALVNAAGRVSLRVRGTPVDQALAKVLAGTGLQAVLVADRVNIVREVAPGAAVQGSIVGKILDAKTSQPVRGATISLDNASTGTVSGDEGTFRIANIAPGTHTLRVRLIGYVKTTQAVTVLEGQAVSVTVTVTPSVNALDQVVVTGTVASTELKAVPNAITVITAKQIEERGITRIDQLFRGDVPGLFAQNTQSENALDAVTMYSRGATALTFSAQGVSRYTNPIKTYVDGVELADPQYLSQIDPTSIERIEILTGPQASTIYGSNAINGVMQVFTKRGGSSASRPRLTLLLQSGWVENDFRSTRTPQHDDRAQVQGVEGHMTYDLGGSWNYVGPWTPAKQTSRLSGFGGARMQRHTFLGSVTVDGSARLSTSRNVRRGVPSQTQTAYRESGLWTPSYLTGGSPTTISVLQGQTLGMTMGYAPSAWWSHEIVLGQDRSAVENSDREAWHYRPSDSLLTLSQASTSRTSLRYATTAQGHLSSFVTAVLTAGGDSWKSSTTSLSVRALTLTGTLAGSPSVTRTPSHNAGGFVQAQVGIAEQLFLTYGLRAEWNPAFGDAAQPNLAPRYGASYSTDLETPLGTMTTKFRASYGRSTRPPDPTFKRELSFLDAGRSEFIPDYGNAAYYIANVDLGPEFQQGGEGGIELYFGSRGSLVVTRYNQTVDGLIESPLVDSVKSSAPFPGNSDSQDADGYGYAYQYEYLNIGSIRNQGWELQGTTNVGPFTATGTYTWMKSRIIGITQRYRDVATRYAPGATFQWIPEHTWAFGLRYARARTSMALNVTGRGQMYRGETAQYNEVISSLIRLSMNRARVASSSWTLLTDAGYMLADVNVTRRFSSAVEGVLQIQNAMDHYQNDLGASSASLGRQTKIGFRLQL